MLGASAESWPPCYSVVLVPRRFLRYNPNSHVGVSKWWGLKSTRHKEKLEKVFFGFFFWGRWRIPQHKKEIQRCDLKKRTINTYSICGNGYYGQLRSSMLCQFLSSKILPGFHSSSFSSTPGPFQWIPIFTSFSWVLSLATQSPDTEVTRLKESQTSKLQTGL